MRHQLVVCLILALPCASLLGDSKKETPKEAKTTADILKGVEPLKGFGNVCTAEFRNSYEQTFVVWYNPYSGEAACNVSAYRFDAKKEQWVRFLSKEFQGTHDVSIESGRGITIRNVKGVVIYKEKAEKKTSFLLDPRSNLRMPDSPALSREVDRETQHGESQLVWSR